MSDDPFDDPEWLRYARRVREELVPMIEKSAVGLSIYNGKTDPKLAIETGYLILLDKPLIAVVTPGSKIPRKLAMVADEIIELNMDDPSFSRRMGEAIQRVTERYPAP